MHVLPEPPPVGDPVRLVSAEQDFGAWVRPHWAAMSALARRLSGVPDWEDVLQESLSAAWRKRAQFDPHRGTPRNWLICSDGVEPPKASLSTEDVLRIARSMR